MQEIVGVIFKENARMYYFATNKIVCQLSNHVIVETNRGLQYGVVVRSPRTVEEKDIALPLKNIVRIATKEDEQRQLRNLQDEEKALVDAKNLVKKLNLNMRFTEVSFTFDRNQLLFYFVSEQRVDFRELAKKLAQLYRTRIELRQIGVRDKAKQIGGLGPCGLFLCCNRFLTDFNSVSINMAKNQFLSLNPTKINGVCGRLLCCLNYEDATYTELKKGMPNIGSIVETEKGTGRVVSVDIFKRKYQVDLKEKGLLEVEVH